MVKKVLKGLACKAFLIQNPKKLPWRGKTRQGVRRRAEGHTLLNRLRRLPPKGLGHHLRDNDEQIIEYIREEQTSVCSSFVVHKTLKNSWILLSESRSCGTLLELLKISCAEFCNIGSPSIGSIIIITKIPALVNKGGEVFTELLRFKADFSIAIWYSTEKIPIVSISQIVIIQLFQIFVSKDVLCAELYIYAL